MPPPFAIATREELWKGGRCVEARLEHGVAEERGSTIIARDDRDAELVAIADRLIEESRGVAATLASHVRLVTSSRRIAGAVQSSSYITIGFPGVSIVSTPVHAAADARWLRTLMQTSGEATATDVPFVWVRGSAAVLLHEAIGHAAEDLMSGVAWPDWLSVNDEPEQAIDDCGGAATSANLLREPPRSMRRESFRDIPLRRMSRLVARQRCGAGEPPSERIEVHVVSGGAYDPLDDIVSVNIAVADYVKDGAVTRLAPFTYERSRARVAASLICAFGDPERYPGVVCSREGQQVVVGSYAPVIVTS